jgi:transposase
MGFDFRPELKTQRLDVICQNHNGFSRYRHRRWANNAIDNWCQLARMIRLPALTCIANMLEHHRYGIVNHCDYPIIQEKSKG